MKMKQVRDIETEKQLWHDPNWKCPYCQYVNLAVRQKCRNCGYDSNAGEFPYYNPLPPYQGLDRSDYRPLSSLGKNNQTMASPSGGRMKVEETVNAIEAADVKLNGLCIVGEGGIKGNVWIKDLKALAAAYRDIEAENARLRGALEKIIDMNRQTAAAQYGDAEKAESWSCVTVARSALAPASERAVGGGE